MKRKTKKRMINKNRKPGEPIVIEFNLSKAVAIVITIIALIITITTGKVVITIIEAQQEKAMASEDVKSSETVIWVNSIFKDVDGNEVVETDADGKEIKIPVPKGYSASQIDGETTASKGFVIYEGDVDWNSIFVDSSETITPSDEVKTEETVTPSDEAKTEEEITPNDEITSEGKEEPIILDDETNSEEKVAPNDDVSSEDVKSKNNESTINELEETTKIETFAEESLPTEEAITEEVPTEETPVPTAEGDLPPTQTEINIFNLQKTTNQYVWVPVEDINEIFGVDAKGKLWGKLYNFSGSGKSKYNWTETDGMMGITNATSYREPDVMANMSSYDLDRYLPQYLAGQTRYEMLAQEMEQNFYEMIKSIKQYGGFYIGRYETGGLNETAVVRKMDTNIASQTWYTMYKKCQKLSGTNDNVTTSMIWGTLWDETLDWLVKSGATNLAGDVITYSYVSNNTYSKTWANYNNSTFEYIAEGATEPVATETKALSTSTRIPTGSADYTKVNNIYDMAGNVWDWTTEAYSTNYRVYRGLLLQQLRKLPQLLQSD